MCTEQTVSPKFCWNFCQIQMTSLLIRYSLLVIILLHQAFHNHFGRTLSKWHKKQFSLQHFQGLSVPTACSSEEMLVRAEMNPSKQGFLKNSQTSMWHFTKDGLPFGVCRACKLTETGSFNVRWCLLTSSGAYSFTESCQWQRRMITHAWAQLPPSRRENTLRVGEWSVLSE